MNQIIVRDPRSDGTMKKEAERLSQTYQQMRASGALSSSRHVSKSHTNLSDILQTGQQDDSIDVRAKVNGRLKIPEFGRPYPKLYTPGPGTYKPVVDRYGRWSAPGKTFGSGDRSHMRALAKRQHSPGPMYLPVVNTSLQIQPPRTVMGRQDVCSRFDLSELQAPNSPFYNPGPTHYTPKLHKRGGGLEAGGDMPAYSFGTSSFARPEDMRASDCSRLAVQLSYDEQQRENIGVWSPGPIYLPSTRPDSGKAAIPEFSMRPRCTTQWEVWLQKNRGDVCSPGPACGAHTIDRGGKELWGWPNWCPFGSASKAWSPELNLSAAPYIDEPKAKRANAGVHSPGSAHYSPRIPRTHVRGPALDMSGDKDRFYNRFELQRIQ